MGNEFELLGYHEELEGKVCWRHAFNAMTEADGSTEHEELIMLSEDKKSLIWLPENSYRAYFLDIKQLKELLPKEEDL